MRVYCGLASAGQRIPVAVVDDAGRLLDSVEVDDTPAGYAAVCALIAERCTETGPVRAAMATDTETNLVPLLLAASGEPLAVGDAGTIAQFISDDPPGMPEPRRRAIALARALQAGTLSATTQPAPRDLTALRPVLAAHRAAAVGRGAAVAMLRDLLRELYPAALRAFPDPGTPLALAVLDRLPDPVRVAHGQDADVVGQLRASGFADAEPAVANLRRAVAEMATRRSGSEAVGPTVRNGVAAVRAADSVSASLVQAIAEHVEPRTGGRGFPAPPVSSPPVPGAPVSSVPVSAQPVSAQPVTAPPVTAPPVTGPPVTRPPGVPARVPEPPVPVSASPVSASPVFTPPVSGPDAAPLASHPPQPPSPSPPPQQPAPPYPPAATAPQSPVHSRTGPQPPLAAHPPAAPAHGPGLGSPYSTPPATNGYPTVPPAGPPNGWTAGTDAHPRYAQPQPPVPTGSAVPDQSDEELSLLTPDELPGGAPRRPAEPSPRTVNPPSGRLGALIEFPRIARRHPPAQHAAAPYGQQPRRDTEDEPTQEYRPPSPRRQAPPEAPSSAPPLSDNDGDLLIFAQARSAWFSGDEADGKADWRTEADAGWNAAEAASRPTVGGTTSSGLPRRVPSANLVPGAAPNRDRTHVHPINRDAAQLAAHTAGYFRGWNRARQDYHEPPEFPSVRHQ